MSSPSCITIFVLVLAVEGVGSAQDKTMQDTLGTRLTATAETIVDVAGFAGGELEAYSRCVVDNEKQLRSKLDQWQTNQANAPRLSEMAHKQLVANCQSYEASLAALVAWQLARSIV